MRGLFLVASALTLFWAVRDRHAGLGRLLLYWILGLLLVRLGALAALGVGSLLGWEAATPPQVATALLLWIGGILVLRALLGFTMWERRWRRREKFAAILLFCAWWVAGWTDWNFVPIAFLALPWLLSLRWRLPLGAGRLLLASLVFLVSVILILVKVTPSDAPPPPLQLRRWLLLANGLALLYAVLAFPAAALRIHLSVRRIRNRLFLSHALAGFVPPVLVAAFLLVATAFFVSTYRGLVASRMLQRMAEERRSELQAALERGAQRSWPGDLILLVREGESVRAAAGPAEFPLEDYPWEMRPEDVPLLWDGRRLWLRLRVAEPEAEGLFLLDSLDVQALSAVLGEPVYLLPTVGVREEKGELTIERGTAAQWPGGKFRLERGQLLGGALLSCLRHDGTKWQRTPIPVLSLASLWEPLASLFSSAETNPLSIVVLIVLGILALFLLLAGLMAGGMVVGMARSVTRAVQHLYKGAETIGKGDLAYRIPVEGTDELWEVAVAFNGMAEGLERLREVERQNQRMEEELRLAREIQARLFPARPPEVPGLELAGVSHPAREVGGDYFDYVPLPDGRVVLTVADVSGKGVPAALLMSSFRAVLRSLPLEEMGPSEILERLNRFLCATVEPGRFVTAFLGLADGRRGEVRCALAGHDPPILVQPSGEVLRPRAGGPVLGLLPAARFPEASLQLEPGGLLVAFTDGITEAEDPSGRFYGEEGLVGILSPAPAEPASGIVERILEHVRRHVDGGAPSDDLTVLVARRIPVEGSGPRG
jgi:serine phosphatase RsbU (regulator of sigma subunit)